MDAIINFFYLNILHAYMHIARKNIVVAVFYESDYPNSNKSI